MVTVSKGKPTDQRAGRDTTKTTNSGRETHERAEGRADKKASRSERTDSGGKNKVCTLLVVLEWCARALLPELGSGCIYGVT